MKNTKKFYFALILLGLFSLAFSFNNNMKREERSFMTQDTIPEDPDVISPVESQDVSAMFNERGYLKSNSASMDENEIINDFNGNLQYSIPLFQKKKKGDLEFNISLNYSSSINYQILASNSDKLDYGILYKYNINAPGWILSVNGMAAMITNFQTKYLTNIGDNAYPGTVQNDDVSLLATGYDITDDLSGTDMSNAAIIHIMRGDGSVISLRRYGGPSGLDNRYIGHFYSEGKNEYVRGEVSFIESGSSPEYRNRELSLMMGNGLTYIYREVKNNFSDIQYTGSAPLRAQGFILAEIRDRFGNSIKFGYSYMNQNSEGRLLLYTIRVDDAAEEYDYFELSYNQGQGSNLPNIEIKEDNTDRKYKIYLDRLNKDITGDKRSNVVKIVNPVNDEINISYLEPDNQTYYERRAKNLYNPASPLNSYYRNMDADMKFSRITSLTNYNGGKRDYKYKTYNNTNYMEINMYPTEFKVMSTNIDGDYFGHGRDLFFTNMLSSKETYDGTNKIKTESFNYHYSTSRTISEWMTETVYESDTLTSTKTITNNDSQNINETPSTIISNKEYKLFRITPRYCPSGTNRSDYAGYTKLIKEEYKTGVNDPVFKTINYSFDITSNIFLDTNITENINGVENRKSFRYWTADGPLSSYYQFDNPIIKKYEFDYFWKKAETNYFIFCDTSICPYYYSLNQWNKTYYYSINQPSSVYIYSSPTSSNWLYKENYEYLTFNDTINYTGYMGQLMSKKVYDANNQEQYQDTKFLYYVRDTVGKYLYGTYFPYHEGNIRAIIDPNGDSTFYYNLPVSDEYTSQYLDGLPGSDSVYSENDFTPPTGIKFIKAYDNNTQVTMNENWYDVRMPIITKYKVKDNYYLSTFKKYCESGQLKWEIGPSKYLTEYIYDDLNRISRATAPYDFNVNVGDYATLKYEYDDANNKSQVYSKMDGNNFKETEYLFDGFYRVKESRLYGPCSGHQFTKSNVGYNYLDQKAYTIDGEDNETRYSYDRLLNPSKTVNADNTYTLVSNTYQNDIYDHAFGISGFINKQVFTDEVGNNFEKYFDAVGNLRRETKFILEYHPEDDSYDSIRLNTDYNYDAMYRLIDVKTPGGKYIHYGYDGYGRQSLRCTPDADSVRYKYDKNNNLRFSQDGNQRHRETPANSFSFKGYDGIGRLLYSGDTYQNSNLPVWNELNPNTTSNFENYNVSPTNFLLINVYDTLSNAIANIFTPPSDYYYEHNITKGKVVATAYRTLGGDNWNYKYYRYDGRGRVIKMWSIIDGLGEKFMTYEYNSQNQPVITEYQIEDSSDYKKCSYSYYNTGLLQNVNVCDDGIPFNFAEYEYNDNSQISGYYLNNENIYSYYTYDSRNRVTNCNNSDFGYTLSYYSNGNVASQEFNGSYAGNFPYGTQIYSQFSYDQSNRLTAMENDDGVHETLNEHCSYDYDGNLFTLYRDFSSNSFDYTNYEGTNRLKNIHGMDIAEFTYDYNGNMTYDVANNIADIKYDYRNLITEMCYNTSDEEYTYKVVYKYDEAGNRIRKTALRQAINSSNPEDPDYGIWFTVKDEFYVRDVSGKEIAKYSGNEPEYLNIWGNDLVGRMSITGYKYYYLKDHLGSIRAVTSEGSIIEGRDYDPWGYVIREYDVSNMDEYAPNKFTGKERDWESGYDYFGARYYDARIGRWGQTEPLYDKYLSYSPYQYGLLNPMKLVDADGNDVFITGVDASNTVNAINSSAKGDFKISMNPNTGKLSCDGTPETPMQVLLRWAITDNNVNVHLETTQKNIVSNVGAIVVGAYDGSYMPSDDKIETFQYFNLIHAQKYEDAGGSTPGESAVHEIIESFVGGMMFPFQGRGQNEDNYNKVHNFIVRNFEKDYYHPKIVKHKDRFGNIHKIGLLDEDESEVYLYDIPERAEAAE
jgi:RHS repeat-associated protein